MDRISDSDSEDAGSIPAGVTTKKLSAIKAPRFNVKGFHCFEIINLLYESETKVGVSVRYVVALYNDATNGLISTLVSLLVVGTPQPSLFGTCLTDRN